MTISGIVVACRPQDLESTSEALEALPWAEVRYRDPAGRLVVIIEAGDVEESMQRVKQLQGLPRVLLAELAEFAEEGA